MTKKPRRQTGEGLSAAAQKFPSEFVKDRDKKNAAIRCGIPKSQAAQAGHRWCKHPWIKAEIDRLTAEIDAEQEAEGKACAKDVINELSKIAFSTMKNYAEWGPGGVTLKQSSDIPDDHAAAVVEVSDVKGKSGWNRSLKLHDKIRALDLIGRHLGMWKDKVEHDVSKRLEDLLTESWEGSDAGSSKT